MSLKTFFKKKTSPLALSVLFGLSTLACTGYRPDSTSSYQADPCGWEPACRSLSKDEIDLAKVVFGNTIPYEKVKIYHRSYSSLERLTGGDGMSPDGNIYVSGMAKGQKDFSEKIWTQPFFLHEMMHVSQHYNGTNMTWAALKLFLKYGFKYSEAYEYDLKTVKDFKKLNIEQQGKFAGDYIRNRNIVTVFGEMAQKSKKPSLAGRYKSTIENTCRDIVKQEKILSQHYPVAIFKPCR